MSSSMPVRVLCWTLNAVFLKRGWGIDHAISVDTSMFLVTYLVRLPTTGLLDRNKFR